jgi:hypothetical protein
MIHDQTIDEPELKLNTAYLRSARLPSPLKLAETKRMLGQSEIRIRQGIQPRIEFL